MKTQPCRHDEGFFRDERGDCCNKCRTYLKVAPTAQADRPPQETVTPTWNPYDPTQIPCVLDDGTVTDGTDRWDAFNARREAILRELDGSVGDTLQKQRGDAYPLADLESPEVVASLATFLAKASHVLTGWTYHPENGKPPRFEALNAMSVWDRRWHEMTHVLDPATQRWNRRRIQDCGPNDPVYYDDELKCWRVQQAYRGDLHTLLSALDTVLVETQLAGLSK